MAKHSDRVASVLAQWSLKPKKVKRVRDVYKVYTDKGVFCLKAFQEKLPKLDFILSVLQFAKTNGFETLADYVAYGDNKYCYSNERGNWVLNPWLTGREPRYERIEEICACAKTLAGFHEATQTYAPQANKGEKNKLGAWEQRLQKKHDDMVDFCEKANQTQGKSRFSRMLVGHSQWLLTHSAKTLELLEASPYKNLCQPKPTTPQICHGDTAARNFLIDEQGNAWLIDFDSLAIDLRVVDLWRLIRRTLRKGSWSFADAKRVLSAYEEVSIISKDELHVLYALLWFPEKQWRLAKKYFNDKHEKGREKLYRRLAEHLANHENKDKFLREFAKYYELEESEEHDENSGDS